MKYLNLFIACTLLLMLGCSGDDVVSIDDSDITPLSINDFKIQEVGDPPVSDVSIEIVLPTVDPNNPAVSIDELVAFMAVPTGGTGTLSFDWDFGDGTSLVDGDLVFYTYTLAGTYTVSVVVTDIVNGVVVGTASDEITLTVVGAPVVTVDIDIKPGSDPNSINPESKGVIPVSILTTENFDATTVDPLSVKFGPNGASECHGCGHIEDVDSDNDLDLVLHFKTQETGIECGDTVASLTGETFDGQAIEGSDAINTVGCD